MIKLSDIVYLVTGTNKEAHIVTATVRRQGSKQYELTCGKESTWHYDFEFSKEKNTNNIIKGLRK
jgi:hypothetical protein